MIDVEDIGTIDIPLNEEEIDDDADAWPQIDGIQEWHFGPWVTETISL